jgi:hypothetical protein
MHGATVKIVINHVTRMSKSIFCWQNLEDDSYLAVQTPIISAQLVQYDHPRD